MVIRVHYREPRSKGLNSEYVNSIVEFKSRLDMLGENWGLFGATVGDSAGSL